MTQKSKPSPKGTARQKLAAAYRAIYAIAALSLFIGLLLAIIGPNIPEGAILTASFLIFGFLYLLLGWLVQKRKSMVALGIAVAIMGLNLLGTIYNTFQGKSPAGIFLSALFLSQTVGGFEAIKELKKGQQ